MALGDSGGPWGPATRNFAFCDNVEWFRVTCCLGLMSLLLCCRFKDLIETAGDRGEIELQHAIAYSGSPFADGAESKDAHQDPPPEST